jgi:16S rRNA (uracil1498-N3)-methyltransferase
VSTPRFFVDGVYLPGESVALRGEDARKIAVVLRMHAGASIEVIDAEGNAFAATIDLQRSGVTALLGEPLSRGAVAECTLVLAQAIPKGQKMDFVVEKATELGVASIVPLVTERTIADASPVKLERWRRLARAAAAQSGRVRPAEIEAPLVWAEFCAQATRFGRVIVPWERAERVPLRERLTSVLAGARKIAIAIGPEGGFAQHEVELAVAAGATSVSLGARVLRTETAGLVVCSILRYALGEM